VQQKTFRLILGLTVSVLEKALVLEKGFPEDLALVIGPTINPENQSLAADISLRALEPGEALWPQLLPLMVQSSEPIPADNRELRKAVSPKLVCLVTHAALVRFFAWARERPREVQPSNTFFSTTDQVCWVEYELQGSTSQGQVLMEVQFHPKFMMANEIKHKLLDLLRILQVGEDLAHALDSDDPDNFGSDGEAVMSGRPF
jgi:hypothetical protein